MSSVSLVASAQLPTPWGVFTMTGFKEEATVRITSLYQWVISLLMLRFWQESILNA